MRIEETFQGEMAGGPWGNAKDKTDTFYFRTHILMIAASVAVYLTAIGWMIWCLVKGGGFEFAVVPVVSAILLGIMLAVTRSLVIIVGDGRPKPQGLQMIPAQSKTVSVEQWAIRKAGRPSRLS